MLVKHDYSYNDSRLFLAYSESFHISRLKNI